MRQGVKKRTFFSLSRRAVKVAAESPFWVLLLLFLCAVLISSIVFSLYAFPREAERMPFQETKDDFQIKAFQQILREWELRAGAFQKTDEKIHPNIFQRTPLRQEVPDESGSLVGRWVFFDSGKFSL